MPACKMLDNHMCITVSGMWRPCCRFDENVQPWAERMKVKEHSFEQYKNSAFYKDIIDSNKTGWHDGCKGCKVAEETGNKSTRLVFDDMLSGNPSQLEYIEISLSNECNLACKMCGPWASSTWSKIVNSNTDIIGDYRHVPKFQLDADIEQVFGNVDLTHLKQIKLLGGEPFITPQTWDLLKFLDKKDLLKNIKLMTNTNTTFFPKKMIPYLEKFKTLSIALSLDGIYDINDYVRYKSKWSTVEEVLDKWTEFFANRHDKNGLKITSCINAYNVHQLPEILEFAKSKKMDLLFNIINGPKELRLDALPQEYVSEIKHIFQFHDTLNSVYKYFEAHKSKSNLVEMLKDYTKRMDSITGMDLKNYNHSLAKHLDI